MCENRIKIRLHKDSYTQQLWDINNISSQNEHFCEKGCVILQNVSMTTNLTERQPRHTLMYHEFKTDFTCNINQHNVFTEFQPFQNMSKMHTIQKKGHQAMDVDINFTVAIRTLQCLRG